MKELVAKKIDHRRKMISLCKNMADADLDFLRKSAKYQHGAELRWLTGAKMAIIKRAERGDLW